MFVRDRTLETYLFFTISIGCREEVYHTILPSEPLSLLALIFAYDAITGEREHGTLHLVLTHSVGRGYILFAKYFSAMLCLLVPLLISMLLAVILLTTSPSISLNINDFFRIGGIVIASIAYLSVFYLIGLLISVMTRRTSTALMLSMFIWGFLVLVYPNIILTPINPLESSHARTSSAYNQIKQIWEEFDRERKHFLTTDAVLGEDATFNLDGPRGGTSGDGFSKNQLTLTYYYWSVMSFKEFCENHLPQVTHAQNYYRFLVPKVISAADRTWLIRKQALEDIFVKPALVDRVLLKLSPVGLYDAATQATAGTEFLGIRDFFEAARQYRQTLISYLYDRNAFGSQLWIAADQGQVDWNTMPQFSFKRNDVKVNAKRAFPDICLLLIISIVLFIVIFLIFIKSEI